MNIHRTMCSCLPCDHCSKWTWVLGSYANLMNLFMALCKNKVKYSCDDNVEIDENTKLILISCYPVAGQAS